MIFDQPPAELPVATLRPREVEARLLLDVRRWLAARWRWLRPRSIPVAAALVGMLAVIGSASYLRDLAIQPPERVDAIDHRAPRAHAPTPAPAPDQVARLKLKLDHGPAPEGASVISDGKLTPGVYPIKLTPAAQAHASGAARTSR